VALKRHLFHFLWIRRRRSRVQHAIKQRWPSGKAGGTLTPSRPRASPRTHRRRVGCRPKSRNGGRSSRQPGSRLSKQDEKLWLSRPQLVARPDAAVGQGRRCRPRWRRAAVPSIADELTTAGTAVGPGQHAGSITERLVGSFWDRSAVFRRSTANNHGQAHERRVVTPVGVAKPSSVLIHFSRHQPYSGVQSSKRQLMPSSCSRSCRDAGKRNWKVALWAPHLSS
jgi:hypothetical protein